MGVHVVVLPVPTLHVGCSKSRAVLYLQSGKKGAGPYEARVLYPHVPSRCGTSKRQRLDMLDQLLLAADHDEILQASICESEGTIGKHFRKGFVRCLV